MSPVEFEPTISAGERPQTYALDRAATGTDVAVDITITIIKMAGSVKFGERLEYLGSLIFKGTVLCGIRSKNIVFVIMSLSFILF